MLSLKIPFFFAGHLYARINRYFYNNTKKCSRHSCLGNLPLKLLYRRGIGEIPFLGICHEGQMYETVHAVHCYGENDFSFWQVTIPLYMVRNILNSAENDTGTMADILDRLPRGPDPEGTTFHFLF